MTAIAPPPVGTESEPSVERDNAIAAKSLQDTLPATRAGVTDTKNDARTTATPRATSRTAPRASVGALLGFGAATLLAGAVSGLVNRRRRNKVWYRLLDKPSFTPPDRVFALVWPVLYTGAAVSVWRVWKTPPSKERSAALALWGTQLALNASWSPIFFGAHRPRLALADLAGNAAALAAYTAAARKVDGPAAALVVPYLGWLGFAAAMNAGVIRKNRGPLGRLLASG